MKKKFKTNLCYKKLTPKVVTLHSWKKLQVLEEKLFYICADKIFKTVCKSFLKQMNLKILLIFVILWSQKLLFSIKSFIKHRLKKT